MKEAKTSFTSFTVSQVLVCQREIVKDVNDVNDEFLLYPSPFYAGY
ncbi:MAG: hypothetical protein IJ456_11085 [Bacteroides sp.]|nr:hypothetical protein [Bacteroides sp.]